MMLRSDFDNHPLWGVLNEVEGHLNTIVEEHQPEELPNVERIRVQLDYVRTFDIVASTRAAFFHPNMLSAVQSVWDQVNASVAFRTANGSGYPNYVQQAADQAETGLLQMGAWPRPYGKGGEVKQMDTLFERLLEAQRISIDALNQEHATLRQEVADHGEQVDAKRDEVMVGLESARAELTTLRATIDQQSEELSTAVEAANDKVGDLTSQNSKAFEAWTQQRAADLEKHLETQVSKVVDRTASADEEYEKLLAAKDKYTKLVGAIAADEVASQFETEAKWGRRTGNTFYGVGFGLLALAVVPLIFLLFDTHGAANGINWTTIIGRLAIGVLAGSAATVAIRLGSRLINNANAIKRMELELRAIGPFLANVTEKPKVDEAFIDLVSKAFGNSYAQTASTGGKEASDDKSDDRTAVSLASQVLDLVEKARKVTPPGV